MARGRYCRPGPDDVNNYFACSSSQLAASYTLYLDMLNGVRRLDEIRRFHSLDYDDAKKHRILALTSGGVSYLLATTAAISSSQVLRKLFAEV